MSACIIKILESLFGSLLLVLTWEEHGGHHLRLFQGVDNAALEGLADGGLQVAGREEGRKRMKGG